MAQYELIIRLDGALWLTIIFEPPPDPKKGNGKIQHPKSLMDKMFPMIIKSSRVGIKYVARALAATWWIPKGRRNLCTASNMAPAHLHLHVRRPAQGLNLSTNQFFVELQVQILCQECQIQ